ncbi:MAG: glycolate oxidase subunit GlcE [Halioglobus sp.]
MADLSGQFIDRVAAARAAGTPLYIEAGGSKRHLAGRSCDAPVLNVSGHRGIVDLQPSELVVTARAGTPLTELAAELGEHRLELAFEPPLFSGNATVGGTLACNFSGPARPWQGSIRDAVLGVQLINGKAELLNFGGKVMKNVAGYDVSRLQAGALGTLGLLSEITLKVMPQAEARRTLAFEVSGADAISIMNNKAALPGPLNGACWVEGRLLLRLSGAEAAVTATAREWGGDVVPDGDDEWAALKELTLPFFNSDAPLWRASIRANAPFATLPTAQLIDWGGAQRWLRGEQDATTLQSQAQQAGGHISLFRGGNRTDEVRQPLNTIEKKLTKRLKDAFDPDGIFNPGRLYSWL